MIYVFFAQGFEEVEALATVDMLRRCSLETVTVGVGGKTVVGSHGIPVVCDRAEDEVEPNEELQAVVLPGGMPGTLNLEKNRKVRHFITYAAENGRVLAAICAAPSVLGHMGLLHGVEAICYPGYEEDLHGARLSESSVVTDGSIVTAKGCGVAMQFGLELARRFVGDKKVEEVAESIQLW